MSMPQETPQMSTVAAAVRTTVTYRKFICHACGWIYDESVGDPDSGLLPGTRYEDIPEDWFCPLCGVTKADFSPYDEPKWTHLKEVVQGNETNWSFSMRQQAGVVIVGAGRAGWQTAEAIRALDADVPITLVTACSGDLYDKPLLSVAMAKGLAAQALVKELGTEAAKRLRVRLMANTYAVHVNAGQKRVRTTRGTLAYQQLVLAHGARAVLPEGFSSAACWTVNHLQTYQRLREAMGTVPQDILIIGAGLIGCELANDLALGGHRLTLIDVQTLPLARWPQADAATPLMAAWKDLPIRFMGCTQVQSMTRDTNGRCHLVTEDRQVLQADQVIVCAGLQTPARLAMSADLMWRGGIEVNAANLRTSDPSIYALGDCIVINGHPSRFIEPIARQARTIAADIVGGLAVAYEHRAAPVRVKTSSCFLTLH